MATILVVEDNDDVREMMSVALEVGCHTVHTAFNGLEALSRLHEGLRPDVILLDLMMPLMNGWEFRAALRDVPGFCHIPVVVVSAVRSGEDIEEVGSTWTLGKPVDIDEMLHLVDEICRRQPSGLSGLQAHP